MGAFADAALVLDVHGVRTFTGTVADDDAIRQVLRQHPHWVRAVAFSLTES